MGELWGGLEGLGSGEAAGVNEVLLDGEARDWGNSERSRSNQILPLLSLFRVN
jgi:hypothetical protein